MTEKESRPLGILMLKKDMGVINDTFMSFYWLRPCPLFQSPPGADQTSVTLFSSKPLLTLVTLRSEILFGGDMSWSEWTLEYIEGPTASIGPNVSWLVLWSVLMLPQQFVSFPATTQHHDKENSKHGSTVKRNELQILKYVYIFFTKTVCKQTS